MGIVNLSSGSFSSLSSCDSLSLSPNAVVSSRGLTAGSTFSLSTIVSHAETLVKNGAHILDVGAVPTNPSILNACVEPDHELALLRPVLCEFKKQFGSNVLLSVDTYSPIVAHALAEERLVDIVNDVCGGRNIENGMTTMNVVSKFSLGYVLMHMSGGLESLPNSLNAQSNLECLDTVFQFFVERQTALKLHGIDFCVFDPGIGAGRFGKSAQNNVQLLSEDFLKKLGGLGQPILIGLSRKSFLGELYPELIDPFARDEVSKIWEMKAFERGVKIIRTHMLESKAFV